MPRPAYRSRTIKRKVVRTPGGRLVVHYFRRKLNPPRCALCKKPLPGFPKMRLKDARKGHRPPTRIYGGFLCASCLRSLIKKSVRQGKVAEHEL
ncbi:MAG: 50S ribosomal protein L34e [Thermoprotei archaeon]|nr:MAG: 50S ribosomal protein L34e [Thermoprotei archaeon]